MTASACVLPEELRGFGTEESPTFRSLAKLDSRQVESCLLEESLPDLGHVPIPPNRYTSYEYHRREVEEIWLKSWQVVCREDEISGIGDHFIYNVAGLSYIIVRTAENNFKAFKNVCLHRGRKLVDGSGCGASHFKCAYHAWTWLTLSL
jgi:nitrite reductase/ring-hydroxylating ferredoxin subunit